jgi:hypothetical protein
LRVLGKDGAMWAEILRFDDFVEGPHYHAPAENRMDFDRALGDPMEWYVAQVRDHLAEWFELAGFGRVLGDVDLAEVTRRVGEIEQAMVECVPEGCARVPGYGLKRLDGEPAAAS